MMPEPVDLIPTRQWASHLAMPIFVAGVDGTLLFYNEPAEAILGRRYDEAGDMPLAEFDRIFATTAEDGTPVAAAALPLGIALFQRRAAHGRLRFRGLDGVWRTVETTAMPLEGEGGRHLGALAIFWLAPAT